MSVFPWAAAYPGNIRTRYVNPLVGAQGLITRATNTGSYLGWRNSEWQILSLGVAMGNNAIYRSVAIALGPGALSGNNSEHIAIGKNATISNASLIDPNIVIGDGSNISGIRTVAIGKSIVSSGNHSVVLGTSATATGFADIAIGNNASKTTAFGISLGPSTNCTVASGLCLGPGAAVTATTNSVGIGCNAASIDATGAAAPPATKLLGVTVNGVAYRIPLYA